MKWPWVGSDKYESMHEAFIAECDLTARLRISVEAMERALAGAEGKARAYQEHAERADARFDALWQQYLEATRPKEPKAQVVGRYKTDEQVVRVVEDGFVEKLKAELRAKGIPDPLAQAEAERIRKQTTQYGVAQ